jgi:hypothetical protein
LADDEYDTAENHMAAKSLERFHAGQPPVFEPDVIYGYERDDNDEIVLVPIGRRIPKPCSFKNLTAY